MDYDYCQTSSRTVLRRSVMRRSLVATKISTQPITNATTAISHEIATTPVLGQTMRISPMTANTAPTVPNSRRDSASESLLRFDRNIPLPCSNAHNPISVRKSRTLIPVQKIKIAPTTILTIANTGNPLLPPDRTAPIAPTTPSNSK